MIQQIRSELDFSTVSLRKSDKLTHHAKHHRRILPRSKCKNRRKKE
ncbi:hypothetical protein LEP1GSC195_3637 [Leptospira wolbachii serovar Codice str. CDC]|uniref:Uncharacterized protein n=1 Tax=Leptospira wolbachii serovar Codice str. CDC TaxID=1218599 RepID=R9A5V9_9LEPT|nr:hypothetical protein [Leptospira wolbachii]EOQ95630.1 hypothetical protein LEP1GSC195_3637 [Leptospira wolbachii serovar Codice str. CDC]